jgi:hypothetical protein
LGEHTTLAWYGLAGAQLIVMPVIQRLLERWGFVKLDRYGLVRTPEDRILSMRPAVLDDGTGGRIVGWRDNDLAMAELPAWSAATPAVTRPAILPPMDAAPSQVSRPSMAKASEMAQVPVAVPVAADPPQVDASSAVPTASERAQVPAAPDTVMPVPVAPEPTVDEDDWEWKIALARARAGAEEAETGAAEGPPPSPALSPAPSAGPSRAPAVTKTRPMAVIASEVDYEDYSVTAPAPVMPLSRVAPQAAAPATPRAVAPSTVAPSTVIPVPALPSVQSIAKSGRFAPVVRTASTSAPPDAPARFAKNIGSVDQTATLVIAPPLSDDTVPNLSIGDKTRPGVALPPAARAVQLPSVKRRMSRQR